MNNLDLQQKNNTKISARASKIIIGISILLVIILTIYFVFDRSSKAKLDEFKKVGDDTTISTSTPIIGTDGGSYTIEQVPINEGKGLPQPMPDLSRKVVFNNNLSQEVKDLVQNKVSGLQAELSKKPEYFEAWLDLGTYSKMAGDYEGAKMYWTYASRLYPGSFIPLGNLGDLYAYYLKDNGMAENYYKQAISKGPTQVYLYIQLASVYRDVFKDTEKAKLIVEEGLKKVPNDQSLLEFKAGL